MGPFIEFRSFWERQNLFKHQRCFNSCSDDSGPVFSFPGFSHKMREKTRVCSSGLGQMAGIKEDAILRMGLHPVCEQRQVPN